ncbi:MAG: sodium/proton-translocating pyrophosphatase, partial [Phycisphaerales bacterium]|nr:sodium/proton-translocating pyrophosphatase [Phycisphaerales bacterium]
MNDLLKALNTGVWGSSFLIVIGSLGVLYVLLKDVQSVSYLGIWGAILSGLIAGLVIAKGSEIYTSFDYKPTQNIAQQAMTGPATVIIAG